MIVQYIHEGRFPDAIWIGSVPKLTELPKDYAIDISTAYELLNRLDGALLQYEETHKGEVDR